MSIFDLPKGIHCDDIASDPATPVCVRDFLRFHRAPAVDQLGRDGPKLFARLACDSDGVPAGTLVRVTMASRFGDVGITANMDQRYGYSARVALADLTDFTADAPRPQAVRP